MTSSRPSAAVRRGNSREHAGLLIGAIGASALTGLLSPTDVADPRAVAITAVVCLWASMFATWFLSRAAATFVLVAIAVVYGAVLLASGMDVSHAAVIWLGVCAGFTSISVILTVLSRQVEILTLARDQATRTDALTGLLNRAGLTERFDLEVARSKRSGRPLSVLVGDVDGLRAINEELGRSGGDAALASIGRVIHEQIRVVDAAARYGGEEFAVLLPDTPQEGALIVAGRLRSAIAEGTRPTIARMSFGVASYPKDGAGPGALLHVAEQAVVSAKNAGGDRSAVPDPEAPTAPPTGEQIDELFTRA